MIRLQLPPQFGVHLLAWGLRPGWRVVGAGHLPGYEVSAVVPVEPP